MYHENRKWLVITINTYPWGAIHTVTCKLLLKNIRKTTFFTKTTSFILKLLFHSLTTEVLQTQFKLRSSLIQDFSCVHWLVLYYHCCKALGKFYTAGLYSIYVCTGFVQCKAGISKIWLTCRCGWITFSHGNGSSNNI